MKWNYFLDKQPENGSVIVQLDTPWWSDGTRTMGMRIYHNYGVSFKDYQTWCEENGQSVPKFWWVYAKDFPFPDWPERLNGKTPSGDAKV
jgi:hypothetical protein